MDLFYFVHPKDNNHNFASAAGIDRVTYGHYAQLFRLFGERGHLAKRTGSEIQSTGRESICFSDSHEGAV